MDRESEQLQQIKSYLPDEDFVLEERRAFELAEKGRKMTLEGLCVSRIVRDEQFAVLHNSVNRLPASQVQLLFDEAVLLPKKADSDDSDCEETGADCNSDHEALLEQLVLTGHITKLELDFYYTNRKKEYARWLIHAAVQCCSKLEYLKCDLVDFCLSLENTCVLRKKRDHPVCDESMLVVPLERLQHLTRLAMRIFGRAHEKGFGAASLVRVVEALPKLEYLVCWELCAYDKQMATEFVALVQPVLERNKRVLEVKTLVMYMSQLKVDFSSNLKVQELELLELEEGHLDKLRNIGGVTKLKVAPYHRHIIYSLVEILGPRGLESFHLSDTEDPRGAPIDLCRLFAAAPKLSSLEICMRNFDNDSDVIEEATEEQLRAINFEKMRCMKCDAPCNNFLPFLENFVLRAEGDVRLDLERPEQIELVLRLLREHPECCTRVSKLDLLESRNMKEVLEVATCIALRSPILKSVVVQSISNGAFQRPDRDFEWFLRLCSSNGIDFLHI